MDDESRAREIAAYRERAEAEAEPPARRRIGGAGCGL